MVLRRLAGLALAAIALWLLWGRQKVLEARSLA